MGQRPEGRFAVGGDEYAVALRDLPTIVETYKTYDDVNMVKCTDIGQVSSSLISGGNGGHLWQGFQACCYLGLGNPSIGFMWSVWGLRCCWKIEALGMCRTITV